VAKQKVSVTTAVVTEVKLQPKTRAILRTTLTEYADLAREIDRLKEKQEQAKERVEQIFLDAGQEDALVNGCEIEGYKVSLVCGTRSELDKKKLVELGCDPEWLAAATTTKKNKPYVRISAPKDEK
jgi:hypothetical protein